MCKRKSSDDCQSSDDEKVHFLKSKSLRLYSPQNDVEIPFLKGAGLCSFLLPKLCLGRSFFLCKRWTPLSKRGVHLKKKINLL